MTALSVHTRRVDLPRRPATVIPFPRAGRGPLASATPRAASAPLRLTRRAHVLLSILLGALVATVVVFAAGAVADALGASAAGGPAPAVERVTVLPGDTLWSIASANSAGGDVRDTIAEIRRLNGLASSGVTAGQRLVVPVE